MPYQLNEFDLRNILDSFSQPCLLVDTESGQIETGNYLLANKTGYLLEEIKNVKITDLLPDIDLPSIVDSGQSQSLMTRKAAEPLPVQLSFKYIGKTSLLVILTPKSPEYDESITKNTEAASEEILSIFTEIRNLSEKDLFEKIPKALISNKFANDVAFYHAIEKQNLKVKNGSSENPSIFPGEIPTIELDRIVELDIWQPGKRVLSEIHRAGRDKKYQCVYTVPVSCKKDFRGLLVFGYKSESWDENRERSIQYFAHIISTLIGYFYSYKELLNENKDFSSSLEKYSTGFEHTNNGILVLDEEKNIVDFNSAFAGLFGYSPIEIKNKHISRIFGPSDTELINKYIDDELHQAESSVYLTDRNGKQHLIDLNAVPLQESNSNKTVLFFVDQSKNDRLTKTLDRMEKQAALGETLAEFAHDARNIINRQSTGIQLLAKKLAIPIDENKEIASILEDCDNFSDMMESVLSFSRQDIHSFEEIDLDGFIHKILYRNKYKAQKAGIEIQFNNQFPEAKISGDQRSLERVILNLLNNAIEAVKSSEGTVTITQLKEDSFPNDVIIKVADTGPGIPESLSQVLMSSQYTDKSTGTGLGLLISKKIVEAHHGRIKLDSFAGGTIFSIYLPMLG